MKTVKINFIDFFDDFDVNNNDFIKILSKKYRVEISENPDYIFYSCFGHRHLKYDCIRIFYTGECITPDFNECDYAVGFDRLQFGDRYLRVPLYQLFHYRSSFLSLFDRKQFTKDNLKEKTGFCSFVYSNSSAQKKRREIFEKLSLYKRVDSGGKYLNNIGGPVKDKMKFESRYKFSVAFENTNYPGYSTEKIMEAFAAGTIPVYCGDPEICRDFNEKAFINCSKYETLDKAIERIKEIDNNDELYLKIRNEPPFSETFHEPPLEEFLFNIFDPDITEAFRRPRSSKANSLEMMKRRAAFFEVCIYKYLRIPRSLTVRFLKKLGFSGGRK